ncbi:MAG: hypothetical protein MZV64_00610 [Ignavibacteriales bacterium]|nr:hypothetical protein [Ignavibacteriales bacterium]
MQKLSKLKDSLKHAKFATSNGVKWCKTRKRRPAVEKLYLQAKHQFDLAEKLWNRMYKMYQDSVISSQEKMFMNFNTVMAEQMLYLKSKYDMILKGTRYEEIEMAKGLFYQAENGLKEAMAYQDEIYIKSPIDGELQKKVSYYA